ncbi:MAG: hypothetical protein Q4D38_08275 [Planctomycetia bacterium]|nr:hypothetical protein [Planctomycetia bacterium]
MKFSDKKNCHGEKNSNCSSNESKWNDSECCERGDSECCSQLYNQMSLSVSRMMDGEQTEIRIHRETGKPTDIYVSRGGESWSLNAHEIDDLPSDLRGEVKQLLKPSDTERRSWWDSFLSFFTDTDEVEEFESVEYDYSRRDRLEDDLHGNRATDRNYDSSETQRRS